MIFSKLFFIDFFVYILKWLVATKFFLHFLCKHIKMVNKYYQKKKASKRSQGTKILLEKKKKKVKRRVETDIKIFLKKKKRKATILWGSK